MCKTAYPPEKVSTFPHGFFNSTFQIDMSIYSAHPTRQAFHRSAAYANEATRRRGIRKTARAACPRRLKSSFSLLLQKPKAFAESAPARATAPDRHGIRQPDRHDTATESATDSIETPPSFARIARTPWQAIRPIGTIPKTSRRKPPPHSDCPPRASSEYAR